jgi:hypothetical protein
VGSEKGKPIAGTRCPHAFPMTIHRYLHIWRFAEHAELLHLFFLSFLFGNSWGSFLKF